MSGIIKLIRLLGGIGRDRRGIAAVEFAFLAPIMLVLLVAGGEMAQAVMTARNVESLARSIADLTAQEPTAYQTTSTPTPTNALTQSNLEAIMAASSAIMEGAALAPLKMTISAVDITNNPNTHQCCVFTVRWSYTQAGVLRPCDASGIGLTPVPSSVTPSPTNIDNSLMPTGSALNAQGALTMNEAVIVADVSYVYQPPLAINLITFAPSMSSTLFMFPRTYGQVILASPLVAYTDPSSNSPQTGHICY